jgi:hypothetical protein
MPGGKIFEHKKLDLCQKQGDKHRIELILTLKKSAFLVRIMPLEW